MRPSRSFPPVLLAVAAPLVAQSGWVQRQPAHLPPARAFHGFAFDAQRGVHVLFGGASALLSPYDDTWEWNGIDWLQRTPVNSPSARSTHAQAYDFNRGRTVVFGGYDTVSGTLGDTWEFDGANWVQRLPMQSPSPRILCGMAFSQARGRVVLFGGRDILLVALQDTWEWDGNNWTPIMTAPSPSPRHSFGMTADLARGRVLLFGGQDGAVDLADAWSFDGVGWTPLPATQSPPPRWTTALAADLPRGMLVQFGGWSFISGLTLTNETWLHDGSDWRGDARPTLITPRRAAAFSYDWPRDKAVLFGGAVGNFTNLNETWEYDLAGVALWAVAGAGCAGTHGVPQLRPAGPQRAIVGTSHVLEVTAGVTGGALFGFGFSNTNWNGTPLPLSLATFGMPGCALHTSLDVVSFAASAGGSAQLVLAMPNDPGLVGVRFFAQALVPQPGVNAAGAVMSNAVAEVVGAF